MRFLCFNQLYYMIPTCLRTIGDDRMATLFQTLLSLLSYVLCYCFWRVFETKIRSIPIWRIMTFLDFALSGSFSSFLMLILLAGLCIINSFLHFFNFCLSFSLF